MFQRNNLIDFLNTLLKPELFHDYAPNGLQVEGANEIKKVVTGVTANQALFEKAIEIGADTIMVHHGFFWKNENPCLIGFKKKRFELLLKNNINLIGFHLPLDAHPVVGNNAQLGKLFEIDFVPPEDPTEIVYSGSVKLPISLDDLGQYIGHCLARTPLLIQGSKRKIKHIAWCTGGAGDYIERAAQYSVDVFITGEITENIVHVARELGLHLIVAGHHATERYGIQALGQAVSKELNIDCQFIDIESPV